MYGCTYVSEGITYYDIALEIHKLKADALLKAHIPR